MYKVVYGVKKERKEIMVVRPPTGWNRQDSSGILSTVSGEMHHLRTYGKVLHTLEGHCHTIRIV